MSDVKIETRGTDIVVVNVVGRFVTGIDAATLREVNTNLGKLMESGRTKVVLNFADVPYLDSTGVGFLTGAYATTKLNGGELVLAAPKPKVMEALRLMRLDQ